MCVAIKAILIAIVVGTLLICSWLIWDMFKVTSVRSRLKKRHREATDRYMDNDRIDNIKRGPLDD